MIVCRPERHHDLSLPLTNIGAPASTARVFASINGSLGDGRYKASSARYPAGRTAGQPADDMPAAVRYHCKITRAQPKKMLLSRPMKIASLNAPPMPGEYYRRQAARVRVLARDATMPAIREHLADVVLQYEKLAEGAGTG